MVVIEISRASLDWVKRWRLPLRKSDFVSQSMEKRASLPPGRAGTRPSINVHGSLPALLDFQRECDRVAEIGVGSGYRDGIRTFGSAGSASTAATAATVAPATANQCHQQRKQ